MIGIDAAASEEANGGRWRTERSSSAVQSVSLSLPPSPSASVTVRHRDARARPSRRRRRRSLVRSCLDKILRNGHSSSLVLARPSLSTFEHVRKLGIILVAHMNFEVHYCEDMENTFSRHIFY